MIMTRRKIVWVVLLVVSVIVLAGYLYVQRFLNTPLQVSQAAQQITIVPGSSLKAISRQLTEQGIISQPKLFEWYARLQGNAARIQAGEYAITAGMSPAELLAKLTSGKVVQYSFTIVEGWTVNQLLIELAKQPMLTHTLSNANNKNLLSLLDVAEPLSDNAEGQLLPDTYHYVRGTKDSSLLRRAYVAMQKNLAEQWAQRETGLPYKTPYQVLIMASIIEKETGNKGEREKISGVFVRRLRKGMRLQTDPTIIYGLGDKYNGNIRRRDLRTDNPYNTYTRGGMPPTPIALPGLAAINATLHPDNDTTLYFVARGDGSHVFSTTLAEHNEAVIKYQLNGKRKNFSSFSNKRNTN